MEVESLSRALGVEIKGVDLRRPLAADTSTLLARLFAERSLLLFRGQELSERDQLRFIGTLGPVSDALPPPAPDNSIGTGYYLSSEYADGQGELRLHSDHCFLEQPLRGISLYAEAAPTRGGETIFASAVAAARNLPPDLTRSLDGRVAVHTYIARERLGDAMRDPDLPDVLAAEHPVLWHHPVTGMPVLYVNPWMTTEIVGIGRSESRTLLDVLLSYVSDPAVAYRHRWRPGDFLVWDNIALLHARTTYDPSEPRLLFRIQLGLP
jgi:taurine dioxygenase